MKKIIFIFLLTVLSIPTSFAAVPTNGLVGQWELNGDYLDTIGSNHGVSSTTNFSTTNGSNQDLFFNGNDSRLFFDNPILDTNQNFSLSFFTKIDPLSSDKSTLFSFLSTSDSSVRYRTSGDIEFTFWNGTTDGYLSAPIQTGLYKHIAIIRDKSLGISLYIDGVLVDSNSFTGNASSQNYSELIGAYDTNVAISRFFTGNIGTVKSYNRPLSSSEVIDLYNSGQSDLSTSIINGKTCEKRYINFEYPSYYTFDINDSTILEDSDNLNIYSTNFNITDDNFWQLNLSNFASYSSSSDFISALNGDGNFVIDTSLNPFANPPLFTFRFNSPVNTIYIEGSGDFQSFSTGIEPFAFDDYFYISDCSYTPEGIINNPDVALDSISKNHFEFGKKYTFSEDYLNLCVQFPTTWNSDLTINKFLIGTNSGIQFEETLVCAEDDTGDIYYGFAEDGSDLVLFSGPPENIGKVTNFAKSQGEIQSIFGGYELSFITPISDSTAEGFSNELEQQFGILTYLQFIDITLPDTPDLTIDVPMIGLSSDFKIELNTYSAEFLAVTDTLGTSSALNQDTKSKYFISFLLVIFYLFFRFAILYGVFFIFKKFYKYLDFVSVSLFGHGIKHSSSGNVFSLAFYIFFLVSIFSIFLVLFGYILQFDTIILTIIQYGNVFISWLAVSFGDYNFYKTIINFFFSGLLLSFFFFILYQFSTKYLKAN